MRLRDLVTNALLEPVTDSPDDFIYPPIRSRDPDLQELIIRFHGSQELECPWLNGSDIALMGAIYNELLDNPCFKPTPHIMDLIRAVNGKISQYRSQR